MVSKNSATTCASLLARKQIRFANCRGLFYPPRLDEDGTVRSPAVFQASKFAPTTMSKSLIIAEKPSVANDLARALGGVKKVENHFENENHIISSAVGPLVELGRPL